MTTAEKATEIELATKLFRGFADRTRLAILLELVPGELRVVDLVRRSMDHKATSPDTWHASRSADWSRTAPKDVKCSTG